VFLATSENMEKLKKQPSAFSQAKKHYQKLLIKVNNKG